MSVLAGKVASVTGMVQAKNPLTGEVRILKEGDEVLLGDIIVTSMDGNVTITLENGDLLTLGRDTQMAMDEDVVGAPGMIDPVTEGAVDVAALQQAVLEGNFEGLEETAAGGDAGPTGSANAGSNSVERIGSEGEVTSGYETSTVSTSNLIQEELINEPPQVEAEVAEVFEDSIINGQIDFIDENNATVTVSFADGVEVPEGLTLNPDGSYEFDANSYDPLAVDETIEYVLPIVVTDGDGATTESTMTVRVIGINDVPELTNDSGTVIEAGNEDSGAIINGIPSVSGVIDASDIDNGAVLTFSGDADSFYGAFTIDPNTGEWGYVLDNEAANSLAEGEIKTEVFTVTVTDEHGATAQNDVVIDVQGTNDSPVAEDAAFRSQTNSITFSLDEHISDVEDDRDNVNEDRVTSVKITSLPEHGSLYVGDQLLAVDDIVDDIALIRYEADSSEALLFDATRDLVDSDFVDGSDSNYVTDKGVTLTGGTFTGDAPNTDSVITPEILYYGGGDEENGLGVGDDKELNSDSKEYLSFEYPSEVESSIVTLGSIYGHYRDIVEYADAQIGVIALKDGEVVSEFSFNDAHNGDTGRGGTGTFEALIAVDGGYDEIRVFTEAGYNSDMTLQSVEIVNMPIEDNFTYLAVDVEDAYEPATVTLNTVLEPSLDYVFLDQDDVIDGTYSIDGLGDMNVVQDYDPLNNELNLSELMNDAVTEDKLDQYLKLAEVDGDGDGVFDSTLMVIDSNGDQPDGNLTHVYIQGVLSDEWTITANSDLQGTFDLDD